MKHIVLSPDASKHCSENTQITEMELVTQCLFTKTGTFVSLTEMPTGLCWQQGSGGVPVAAVVPTTPRAHR